MSVVTNLPPLPAGTSKVDIVLPGLTTLRNVAVTAAPDATFRSAGPAVREPQFWTYWARPATSWLGAAGLADACAAAVPAAMPTGQRWTPLFASVCRRRRR